MNAIILPLIACSLLFSVFISALIGSWMPVIASVPLSYVLGSATSGLLFRFIADKTGDHWTPANLAGLGPWLNGLLLVLATLVAWFTFSNTGSPILTTLVFTVVLWTIALPELFKTA